MKQTIGFHFEGIYTQAEITVAAQTVFAFSFRVDDFDIEPTTDMVEALHDALCKGGIVHNRVMTTSSNGNARAEMGMN